MNCQRPKDVGTINKSIYLVPFDLISFLLNILEKEEKDENKTAKGECSKMERVGFYLALHSIRKLHIKKGDWI